MKINSAGLINYYYDQEEKTFKYLVAHPGGTLWKTKYQFGFPKGQQEPGEDLKTAAIREFMEETGLKIGLTDVTISEPFIIHQNNKNVYLYLYKTQEPFDVSKLSSNLFEDKITGELVPENDFYKYMTIEELEKYLFKNQRKIIPYLKTVK